MPTRRQNPDEHQFRQDAFASSADFERGVLGNLVAARCQRIADARVIAVLWWLQQVSWRDGGLDKLAEDFLTENAHLVGTPAMHRFGMQSGQIYSSAQVKEVRQELPRELRDQFLLKGERGLSEVLANRARRLLDDIDDIDDFDVADRAERRPISFPASDFREACWIDPGQLAKELKQWLVNPSTTPTASLWNMPGLWEALCQWREREATPAVRRIVETEITRKVSEELDYALEQKTFVLIEGREGIGKSEAAVDWCARHPGQAIYVRLECGSDETTLYRAIARQIGTACSYGRTAVDMRARIQDALQCGHLMLVLDEAHFLWPQSERSERTSPKRIDWLRTALVDFGVPVALISTPQFFARQCDRFRKAGWNSLQIQRRLARTVQLPEELSVDDLLAVARRSFPHAADGLLKRIAALALGTVGYLTTVAHMRKRVDFLAARRPGVPEHEIIAEELRAGGLAEPVPVAVSRTPREPLKPALRGASEPISGAPNFDVRKAGPRIFREETTTV
jgi:hypothetical protein